MTGFLNGIPRVDLKARPLWKRELSWAVGGKLFTTERAAKFWRRRIAPLEGPVMKATGGWHFTDGDDVVLIASNYGRDRRYALAADRLNKGWHTYERRTDGIRTIPVLRLSPAG